MNPEPVRPILHILLVFVCLCRFRYCARCFLWFQISPLRCLAAQFGRLYRPCGASIRSGSLLDIEMPTLSCTGTRIFNPWASGRSGPLEDIEMTTASCIGRCNLIPWAPIRSQPLQDIEMATLGYKGTR